MKKKKLIINKMINKNNGGNNEKIFLCKKVKRNKKIKIFDIKKIKKFKLTEHKLENGSTCESECYESEKKSVNNEFNIPTFFNDKYKILNNKIQIKLQKYRKISEEFEDKEDIELYLISEQSLLKN